jgi:pSer/pThr/pTyr-binding forkhead associated (FHA) protein
MPELTLFLIRIGFLALLWLFVLVTVRVIRNDLFGPARVAAPGGARAATRVRPPRERAAKPVSRRNAPRRLVVVQGPLAGTSVELGDAPLTIGRAPDSTLVLTDDYASSRHARLVPRDGRWLLEDMGSTNGTYVERDKVTGPTPVGPGTPIRIGKTVLELRK